MSDIKRTVLWSAETVQPNNTSITLNDSIDNYDEIIYYGSGTRTYSPCVMTDYPVISGQLNLGGPFFFGNWGATDGFVLCNGTQVFLSGTSGFVASSYYWGKNAANTAYAASLVTNRTDDVRPYMIVGVKYPNNYDRTLIWSSEHTAQLYNTNITLDETVNHFDEIMVLGSGFENGGVGCRHASKNIYNVQDKVMGCDAWAYTPWKLAEKHNLVIGQEMRISGNSGYIGSGYFMGMGNQTNAWAAGKWNTDYQFSATAPYAIYGLKRRPTYMFINVPTEGGSVSSNINPGYSGDIATITVTPESDAWRQSALNITGAELTGNDFMFENSNVTAQAEFEHSRDLTLVPNEHATLSADKMSGFSGDVVTVDATTDEGWYFTGLNVTGATATGNQFMFVGENVTAEGLYTDEGYPITYLSDEHVSVTGDDLYIPGTEGITLDSGYDAYYRISGYDITNGSIIDGKLVPTGPCTIKAVEKINYFTATGNFEKGSNVSIRKDGSNGGSSNVPAKYALHVSHTGDIPAAWYSTSNRWKPNKASAYQITLHPVMKFTVYKTSTGTTCKGQVTAVSLLGTTQTQSQNFTYQGSTTGSNQVLNYNKTFTSNNQNINYGISAKLYAHGYQGSYGTYYATTTYVATGTTGTWTATGIAP
jgi:hypothetical protein